MGPVTFGLLHPGEMGAALGAALVQSGREVLWVPAGRSPATAARAAGSGLVAVDDIRELTARSDTILSVCPPHAALDVAYLVASHAPAGRDWWYLDANAVSPATASKIAATVEGSGGHYVDGGIVGPPPLSGGTTRLYLSGPAAVDVSEGLATTLVEIHVVSDRPGDASALKLAYAAWTKGSAALLLAIREVAARAGVEDALLSEWRTSQPELIDRYEAARRAAATKGWRWSGEMEEIAALFESVGLPAGFHQAAAEIFGQG